MECGQLVTGLIGILCGISKQPTRPLPSKKQRKLKLLVVKQGRNFNLSRFVEISPLPQLLNLLLKNSLRFVRFWRGLLRPNK